MSDEKTRVRAILRARKEAMAPEERREKSGYITRHLMLLVAEGETVMVFTSKEKEVNTKPLILALFQQGNPVVVPIIQKEDVSLRLSYLKDLGALVPSTFGVPEPIGNEIPADPEDVDIIILPMLGFDRAGGRIGYGAGYYDRFLSKHPDLFKIGVAFGCQEMEDLPTDENDVKMDLIVTEEGIVYEGGGGRHGDRRGRHN
ncbi:5-formyltetrahydrofolate cyclo-ligase [Methanoregula sp.]|uniref:5-formyltetrahydrofolate cyclo-ligase n=1 Tax=Methanoregula sp. TaxID=2052170 RepID=UPI002BDC82CC|nr:5-formyltetrahydrofolate cyclo-ligase [Methanoregula sp.]HVP97599.1 5-formyltetrahydrofolate cyclo-ligase [Methanoregula sp.]